MPKVTVRKDRTRPRVAMLLAAAVVVFGYMPRLAADEKAKAKVTVIEVRATRKEKPYVHKSLKSVVKALKSFRWNHYEISSSASKTVGKGSKTRFTLKNKQVIDVELKDITGKKTKRFDLKVTLLEKSGKKYRKRLSFEVKPVSGKSALVVISKESEGRILCFSAK